MPNRHYASKHMIGRARSLRQQETPPEQLLWLALRNKQIGGMKFRRQYPIGPYVVDFCCHSAKLVVEVDGTLTLSHGERGPGFCLSRRERGPEEIYGISIR